MAQPTSPVTGVLDETAVFIDFGKYEGRTVKDLQDIDPAFYDELATHRETGRYAIRRHRDKTFRLYLNPLSNTEH